MVEINDYLSTCICGFTAMFISCKTFDSGLDNMRKLTSYALLVSCGTVRN